MAKRRKFTEEQQDFIRKKYLIIPKKTLARQLGVSDSMVSTYLRKNDLIIPPELALKRQKDSGFQNGHKTFNKGLKQSDYMSAESIESCSKTRFKIGRTPHNTNLEGFGAIVIRTDNRKAQLLFTKTEKGWEPLHRVIWEKEHGKIEEDQLIVFKDKDYTNVDINNLECICRVEHMYRNAKHNYPREIIPSKLLVYKIDKEIENKLKKD